MGCYNIDKVKKIANQAAKKCLKNAISLADCGDLLKQNGHTGPAISMYVLACEELAKGMNFRSIADGLMTVDDQKMGKVWVIDDKAFYVHELKQLLSLMASLIDPIVKSLDSKFPQILQSLSQEDLNNLEIGNITPELGKLLDIHLGPDKKLQVLANERKDLVQRMEELKQSGFYVDTRNGKVMTPFELPEKDYVMLRDYFVNLLSNFSDGIVGNIPEGKKKFNANFMKMIAARQERPTFHDYRRGKLSKKNNP